MGGELFKDSLRKLEDKSTQKFQKIISSETRENSQHSDINIMKNNTSLIMKIMSQRNNNNKIIKKEYIDKLFSRKITLEKNLLALITNKCNNNSNYKSNNDNYKNTSPNLIRNITNDMKNSKIMDKTNIRYINNIKSIKRACLEVYQFAQNVTSVYTNIQNSGLKQDYKPKHILAGERLMLRKFSAIHFEKQMDATAKQIGKTVSKRSKFVLVPTKMEIKQLLVTCVPILGQDIDLFITDAFKNSARYFPMYKDEVISIGFNWNFNQRNIKGKDGPYDIVITNDKPPPGANYAKLSYKIIFWHVFKGRSSDIKESLDMLLCSTKTSSVLKHWKVTKQEEFMLLLTPDLKVNRRIVKIKTF